MQPVLASRDAPSGVDWVTVNEVGLELEFEFEFEDEAILRARDANNHGKGAVLLPQLYFKGNIENYLLRASILAPWYCLTRGAGAVRER